MQLITPSNRLAEAAADLLMSFDIDEMQLQRQLDQDLAGQYPLCV